MEGNQVVLILLKLLNLMLNKISNAVEKLAIMYLKNRQRKRELGLKKGKIIKADRIELMIAKQLKKRLVTREKELKEEVSISKYKLDCYKLEMQSELAELEKNIRKLQGSLEVAKEDIEKKMIQRELNKRIKEKTDFEKEVNKNLLNINHKNNILENEYKKLTENISICDKSIDGFTSNRERDMTASMRNKFELLVKDESLAYSKNKDIDIQQPLENEDRNMGKEYEYIEGDKPLQFDSSPDKATIPCKLNPSPISNKKKYFDYVEKDGIVRVSFNKEEVEIEPNTQPVYQNLESVKIDKNDNFMKEYLEKQKRKSLAKEKNKDKEITR